MENFDARWQAVLEMLERRFGKQPDMEAILFLIGMNEYGQLPHRHKFTKEQKQDLMHVAVCTLLSQVGVYRLNGHDDEGWPHFEPTGAVPAQGLAQEEQLLKECVVRYFSL